MLEKIPEIAIVVAMDEKRGIGKEGKLPWPRIPADMQRFKKETLGHPVIMGRKTYESLPPKFRPLLDRPNIVVTRNQGLELPGCCSAHSIEEALEVASAFHSGRVCVIGGGEVYRQALVRADRLYLTLIEGNFNCDVFFPDYSSFTRLTVERLGQTGGIKYKFVTLGR